MVSTIKFSQMTDGGDIANNDMVPGLLGGENVLFNNPWTFLPPGSTADRPAPSSAINYRLRFNTDTQLYEYYDALTSTWVQLNNGSVTAGPFVIYTADLSFPGAFNLGTLSNGLLKQTVTTGVATPAIALLDTDYYGPGMTGYLQEPAGIKDVNGNIVVQFGSTSSAVNYLTFTNNSTGQPPIIGVGGSDSDISLHIETKGTGGIGFRSLNASQPFVFYTGTSYQHGTIFQFPTTSASRTATWQDASGTVAYLSDITASFVNPTFFDQFGNAIATFQSFGTNAGVDSWEFQNGFGASTSTVPACRAVGSDTNVGMQFVTKGNGIMYFASGALTNQFSFNVGATLNGLNEFNFTNNVSGSTVYTFPNASGTIALLDSHSNLSANNFLSGYTTSATAGGTTTLTVASTYQQFFTGSSNQTLVMPVVSTLVLGMSWMIVNNSSGTVTVESSGANTITTMAPNTSTLITCISTSGTSAASWNSDYSLNTVGVASITGTANQVVASAATGAVTLSLPQSIGTSSAVQFASVSFSSTSGIIGTTTNDNAAAGSVGEWLDSNLSSFANWTTSGIPANLQSLPLTEGDWDVYGIMINSSNGALGTFCNGALSLTSATITPISSTAQFNVTNSSGASVFLSNFTSSIFGRVSLASSGTVYLVAQQTYTGGPPQFAAGITARRTR